SNLHCELTTQDHPQIGISFHSTAEISSLHATQLAPCFHRKSGILVVVLLRFLILKPLILQVSKSHLSKLQQSKHHSQFSDQHERLKRCSSHGGSGYKAHPPQCNQQA